MSAGNKDGIALRCIGCKNRHKKGLPVFGHVAKTSGRIVCRGLSQHLKAVSNLSCFIEYCEQGWIRPDGTFDFRGSIFSQKQNSNGTTKPAATAPNLSIESQANEQTAKEQTVNRIGSIQNSKEFARVLYLDEEFGPKRSVLVSSDDVSMGDASACGSDRHGPSDRQDSRAESKDIILNLMEHYHHDSVEEVTESLSEVMLTNLQELEENEHIHTASISSTYLKDRHEANNKRQEILIRPKNSPLLRMELSLMMLCYRLKLGMNAHRLILDWARASYGMSDTVFKPEPRSRKSVLNDCRAVLNQLDPNDFKPTNIPWLPQCLETPVYARNFLDCVLEILEDETVIGRGGCNLSLPHATNPYASCPTEDPKYCSELHHGTWWGETQRQLCRGKREILVPIVLYVDTAQTDLNDRLPVTPLLMSLGILNTATRKKLDSWVPLAYLPNPKYYDSLQAETEPDKYKRSSQKLQNLHNCLAVALKRLREIFERHESFEWTLPYNDEEFSVILKFAVAFVIGDTDMHNQLCGLTNIRTANIQHQCRMCDILTEDMIDVAKNANEEGVGLWTPDCFIEGYFNTEDEIRKYSNHRVLQDPIFNHIEFGANDGKIHSATPGEKLHMFDKGPLMRCVESLKNMIENGLGLPIGIPSSGNGPVLYDIVANCLNGENSLEAFEIVGEQIGHALRRQSDRDLPKTVFGNDLFVNTKKHAQEQAGVVLCLYVALHTNRGRRILMERKGFRPDFLEKVVRVFEMSLQFGEWLKLEKYPLEHSLDRNRLFSVIGDYVSLLGETIHRGGMGSNLIKFHLLLHIDFFMEKFGPPSGWDSGPLESFHKLISKYPAKLTQRIRKLFDQQITLRSTEALVVRKTARAFRLHCDFPFLLDVADEDEDTKWEDHESLQPHLAGAILRIGNSQDGTPCMKWVRTENDGKDPYPESIVNFVWEHVLPCIDSISVTARSEFKARIGGKWTVFRAHPDYKGDSWFDWAKFDLGNSCKPTPGRIWMFLDLRDLVKEIVAQNGHFNIGKSFEGPVAVVQLFKDAPTNKWRQKEPRSHLLSFGMLRSHLELIPCWKIVASAIVVPNVGYDISELDEVLVPQSNTKVVKWKERMLSNACKMTYESNPLPEGDCGSYFVLENRKYWAKCFEKMVDAVRPTEPPVESDMDVDSYSLEQEMLNAQQMKIVNEMQEEQDAIMEQEILREQEELMDKEGDAMMHGDGQQSPQLQSAIDVDSLEVELVVHCLAHTNINLNEEERRDTLASLDPHGWLNDDAINVWAHRLNFLNQANNSASSRKCLMLTSHFYQHLLNPEREGQRPTYRHKNVESWIRRFETSYKPV